MGFFDRNKKNNSNDKIFELFADALQGAMENASKQGSVILDRQRPAADDFGWSKSNPICVQSLAATEQYLKKLCTKDGKTFKHSGYSSVRTSLYGFDDIGEDEYTLFLDGEKYGNLYFVLYGDSGFPPAGLSFLDDDTDWDLEREAFEKGITSEQLLSIRKMERENAEIKKQMKEEQEQKEKKFKARLVELSKDVKDQYPKFNLDEEMKNSIFSSLMSLDYDMTRVYEYVHREQLFNKKKPKQNAYYIPTFDEYYSLICDYESEKMPAFNSLVGKSSAMIEKEAREHGITVAQLTKIRQMEEINRKLKWQMHIDGLKKYAISAVETKTKYPGFNLMEEWGKKEFQNLIKVIDMSTAYEFTHFSEFYGDGDESPSSQEETTTCMFCRKCGQKLMADSLFCHKCGTKVLF